MNYYDILKVSKNASQKEIRDAYKSLIKKYHPDIYTGNHEYAEKITKDLNDAYNVLSNEEARREYDLSLANNTTVETPIYSTYTYRPNTNQTTEYEKSNTQTFEQKMKNKIYNVVDEKTSKMSKRSKMLMIIAIILFALLLFMLSILDFVRLQNIINYKNELMNNEVNMNSSNTIVNEVKINSMINELDVNNSNTIVNELNINNSNNIVVNTENQNSSI